MAFFLIIPFHIHNIHLTSLLLLFSDAVVDAARRIDIFFSVNIFICLMGEEEMSGGEWML